MPIDLGQVDWFYVAVLAIFVFVATGIVGVELGDPEWSPPFLAEAVEPLVELARIGTAIPMDRDEIDPELVLLDPVHELVQPRHPLGIGRRGRTAQTQAGGFKLRPQGQRVFHAKIALIAPFRLVETQQTRGPAGFDSPSVSGFTCCRPLTMGTNSRSGVELPSGPQL